MILNRNGIVLRREDSVVVVRPGLYGGRWSEREIDLKLADELRLSTGDVVDADDSEGPVEAISSINGLDLGTSADRPLPRPQRNALERIRPDRWIRMPHYLTGRMLDFAAPLGMGSAGIMYGPHGSGLTTALRTVVSGFLAVGDILTIVLLIGSRGEEITDWRRRFPEAEILAAPVDSMGADSADTIQAAELALECAQRQTEIGRHVFLAMDSLTALWGAMLNDEEADAQREADKAAARISIREWFQRAGNFGGEGLLGSGLGGSLTVIGTVWHDEPDLEAEEEGELHPHLRLLEHVMDAATWRLALSGDLAADRRYPAIEIARSLSLHEESFVDGSRLETLRAARLALRSMPPNEAHDKLIEAFEQHQDDESALAILVPEADSAPEGHSDDDFWAGWKTTKP